jgi:ribonuclease-3
MFPDAPDTALGHAFRRPELLRQAHTNRSFATDHNERLEFIGDGVLNCAIARMLYERFPQLPEGDLSRMRASLVNRDTLYRHAVALGLGTAIKLGEGELKSGGAARPSIARAHSNPPSCCGRASLPGTPRAISLARLEIATR